MSIHLHLADDPEFRADIKSARDTHPVDVLKPFIRTLEDVEDENRKLRAVLNTIVNVDLYDGYDQARALLRELEESQ